MNDDFVAQGWATRLSEAGLGSFEALWQLDAGWFEPPNQRRGGWSGVSRHILTLPDGSQEGLFIKRQENHQTWSWRHPLRGEPTFARELRLIRRYQECAIPSLEPIYYAARRHGGKSQAILITRELSGYRPMSDCVSDWLRDGAPARNARRAYLSAIAGTLRHMHDQGIVHNCFFPKHVFVRLQSDGKVDVRIIDLEKSRWRPLRILCTVRDLFSMIRYSHEWSRSDRLYFFRSYLGVARLSVGGKRLWRFLDRRGRRKGRVGGMGKVIAQLKVRPS